MTAKLSRSEQRLHDHAQLLNTLAGHVEADPRSIPCLRRPERKLCPGAEFGQWQDWTSSDYPALRRAAAACNTCPALEACKQYADKWETRGAGVWAGKIRGRPNPPEAPPLEPPGVQTIIEQLQNLGSEHRPHNTREEKNNE